MTKKYNIVIQVVKYKCLRIPTLLLSNNANVRLTQRVIKKIGSLPDLFSYSALLN